MATCPQWAAWSLLSPASISLELSLDSFTLHSIWPPAPWRWGESQHDEPTPCLEYRRGGTWNPYRSYIGEPIETLVESKGTIRGVVDGGRIDRSPVGALAEEGKTEWWHVPEDDAVLLWIACLSFLLCFFVRERREEVRVRSEVPATSSVGMGTRT